MGGFLTGITGVLEAGLAGAQGVLETGLPAYLAIEDRNARRDDQRIARERQFQLEQSKRESQDRILAIIAGGAVLVAGLLVFKKATA